MCENEVYNDLLTKESPMRIVTWTAKTKTQRSVIGRFKGIDWERTPEHGEMTLTSGELCVMINPVGFRHESRWVAKEQVFENEK